MADGSMIPGGDSAISRSIKEAVGNADISNVIRTMTDVAEHSAPIVATAITQTKEIVR